MQVGFASRQAVGGLVSGCKWEWGGDSHVTITTKSHDLWCHFPTFITLDPSPLMLLDDCTRRISPTFSIS